MFSTENCFIWLYECQLCKHAFKAIYLNNDYRAPNPPERRPCTECKTPYAKRIRRMAELESHEP